MSPYGKMSNVFYFDLHKELSSTPCLASQEVRTIGLANEVRYDLGTASLNTFLRIRWGKIPCNKKFSMEYSHDHFPVPSLDLSWASKLKPRVSIPKHGLSVR